MCMLLYVLKVNYLNSFRPHTIHLHFHLFTLPMMQASLFVRKNLSLGVYCCYM